MNDSSLEVRCLRSYYLLCVMCTLVIHPRNMKRRDSKDWFTAYCQSGPPVVSDIAPMLRVINKFNLYDKLYTCRREYSSKVICDIDDDDDDDDDNDRQVIMNVSRMSKTRTLDETTCSQSSFPASTMIRRCCARQKIVEVNPNVRLFAMTETKHSRVRVTRENYVSFNNVGGGVVGVDHIRLQYC